MSPYLSDVSLAVHGLMLAVAKKPPAKSGSSATLLLLVGFGLLVYLFVLRPRSQRARKAQQVNRAADVGDEVMLTSGIIGRVTGVEGDRATIEIAPEIEVEVVRRAIGQVLTKAEGEESLEVAPDPGYDAGQHDGTGPHVAAEDEDGHYDAAGPQVATEVEDGHPDAAAAGPHVGAEDDAAEYDDHDESAADGTHTGDGYDTAGEPAEPGPGAALDLGKEGRRKS